MNYRLFLLFIIFVYSIGAAEALNSAADFAGLLSLRGSLGLRARDWPIKSDPCVNWTGVTCRSGRVVGLNISGLRRTHRGQLSPKFAVDGLQNLTLLSSFNASGFLLPGPIPEWFGRRLSVRISSVDLRSAGLNGSIPADIGLLGNLTTLLLSHNALTGQVPSPIGNLTALVSLDLSHNNLSGSFPASLFSLPGLTLLDLSSNNLTGKFPDLSSNVNASGGVFNLSDNFYYGRISSSIGVLAAKFNLVDISNNYFEGEVIATNGSGNISIVMNCFRNALNQKNTTDCEEFYREKGEPFDGLSPPESPPKKSSSNWKYILGGVLGGVALLIVVIVVTSLCLIRRRRPSSRRSGNANGVRSLVAPMPSSPATVVRESPSVGELNYEKLFHATSGFSDMKLIKHGHIGDLYFGVLEDGLQVVVKRIDVKTVSNEVYAGELSFFAKFSHGRFAPFLGHCSKGEEEEEEEEELLVYKYLPIGDLTSALHKKPGLEEDGLPSLDWITRLKIAIGIAEALCFLHHECTPPMVHRDVQASSILLDEKYEVRLGSLSEVCAQQSDGQQNVFARILRSSKKLERSSSGAPAVCAYDVYCLGKVLLELVTGKLGVSGSSDANMSEWLESTLTYINIHEKELVTKIVDPSLIVDEDHLEEVWAVAIVAKSCLNLRPSRRPLARYVLKALEDPLRVVREDNRNSSSRIRNASSRGSWHSAFHGSLRQSSESLSAPASRRMRDDNSLRNSTRSLENGGELSFSFKKSSREIFSDPSGLAVDD